MALRLYGALDKIQGFCGSVADLVKATTAVSPRCVASAQGAYVFHTSSVAEMRKKQTTSTSTTTTSRQLTPVNPLSSSNYRSSRPATSAILEGQADYF